MSMGDKAMKKVPGKGPRRSSGTTKTFFRRTRPDGTKFTQRPLGARVAERRARNRAARAHRQRIRRKGLKP